MRGPAETSTQERPNGRTSLLFREPQTLAALTEHALAERIRTASAADPLRVWVPACAGGEEAYTIAICLLEQSPALAAQRLQIFATDTDDAALALTRAGEYPRRALEGVAPARLASYFEPAAEERVRVRPQVRELLSIGAHDALRDPPIFSRLDLISARNLPAHLTAGAAARFAATAEFALRSEGRLLLAQAADAAPFLERFVPLADGVPLYGKRPARGPIPPRSQRSADELAAELEAANAALREMTIQLRSLREERAVLDVELQHKVRALEASNDDLGRLIDMLGVAAVFLDPDQRIRRYAGSAEALLGVGPEDLGRSIAALGSPLTDASLLEAVRHALLSGALTQRELNCENQRWYLRRIRPPALAGPADGTVITWIDITPLKALQQEVSRIAELEQQRIGQELHDGIQQELTALGLFAQNLREALAPGGEPRELQLAARLTEGIALVNRHVQSLARGLVPVPIDAGSLCPALAELARSTAESARVACEFTLEGEVRLPNSGTATHLYRIAQEAVRNALQHAQADRIAIRLEARGGTVCLEVRDNGIGLPPRTPSGRGLGLRLMEHRCALIGGAFSAQSAPGGGTRVAVTVPAAETPH